MRESEVETYLNARVLALKGVTRKLKWGNQRNAPDRFIALFGQVWLVEVKKPGEKLRAAQAREHARLQAAGVKVAVVDSLKAVDLFIENTRPKPLSITSHAELPDGAIVVMHPKIPPHKWNGEAFEPIKFNPVGANVDIKA